jgi:XTP/dITP diphosphohydrolase
MEKRIIFATGNQNKMKEIHMILADLGMPIYSMKEAGIDVDIEENGTTFEENALIKARAIMKLTGQITMADDSGLEIDYLNKAPGVYSARFMGHDTSYDIKNKALIQKLEGVKGSDRSGRFVCAIAVCFPDGREIVKRGTMEGLIAEEIKGDNGFGYDPIVYLPEYGKTSGELAPEEKNKISHRGKALALIKEELDKSEELYAEDNDSK